MKKLLTICLMLLGAVAQAQNFAITATTEAAIRKNVVRGNAANYGFGMINDTLRLIGLNTRYDISSGSFSKNTVGLGNVDNTSDASKPISTATQTALDAKQATLSGTGFVKSTAGTISYDNSTYLTTSTAASTYLPIANPTATGTLTAPTIANSLGANFATTSGFVGINTTINNGYKLDVNGSLRTVNDAYFATTSGSVGIGTTFPSSILHTIGTIQTSSTSSASSSYATRFNNIIFSRSDIPTTYTNAISNSWSGTTTDQTMNFEVGSGASTRVTAMSLLGNGNVGIGTTAPASKLHISGTGDNTIKINSTATNNPYLNLTLQNTGSTPYGILEAGDGVAYRALALNPTSGNVMIGTSSNAGYKLDVNGTARITSALTLGSGLNMPNAANINFLDGSAANRNVMTVSGNNILFGDINNNFSAASNIYSYAQSSHNFYVNNNFAVKIDANGSVGIGTTSPSASAIFDITTTTKGILFPRLTTTQINAISSPADGLTVYNTTLKVICFYDSSAAAWRKVSHSAM